MDKADRSFAAAANMPLGRWLRLAFAFGFLVWWPATREAVVMCLYAAPFALLVVTGLCAFFLEDALSGSWPDALAIILPTLFLAVMYAWMFISHLRFDLLF